MSKTPELPTNSVAKILPVLWLVFIFIFAIIVYFFIGSLSQQFNEFIDSFDNPTVPSVAPAPSKSVTRIPTIIVTKVLTPKPTKIVVACTRLNIREGEFASNKCYVRSDYDNLMYYLQRFDSANFDLDAAQGSINITCNCRVPQECEFFKNSCNEAKAKRSTAEANLNSYRSTIRTIISRGK